MDRYLELFSKRMSVGFLNKLLEPTMLVASIILLFSASLLAHESAYHKIEQLTHEINRDSDNTQHYLNRAAEYRSIQDWVSALADYKHVSEIQPDHEQLTYFRGLTYLDAGRFHEARRDFDRYLLQHPDHSDGLIARARTFQQLGLHRKAHNDYSQAMSLLTNPPASLFIERANALAEAGEAGLSIAIQGLDEGIRQFGPLVVLETTAIRLEMMRAGYKAALQRVDSILAQVTRKEKWLAMQGEILEESGQLKQARSAYNNALKAIESLPERIRRTAATQTLSSELLQRLNKSGPDL